MKLRDKLAMTIEGMDTSCVESSREAADAIIAALPECVPDLVWESEQGTYYTDLGDGRPDYNFATSSDVKNFDEPIIVYLGQTDLGTREALWTVGAAKAAANAHNRAAVMAAFGVTL